MDLPLQLVQWTGRIGEPLYQCQPPTGLFTDKAEAWVNTGALLNRMNFSLALTANRLRGAHVDMQTLIGRLQMAYRSARDAWIALSRCILAGQASPANFWNTLEKQLNDPQILQASLDDSVRQVNVRR